MKAYIRPSRSLRPGLNQDSVIFKEIRTKFVGIKILIVYVIKCRFNQLSIYLYF